MLIFRGDVEKTINEQSVHFRFNMAALTLLGDLQNASLTELGRQLIDPKLSTIANFLYAGAYTYCKQEKKIITFTQDDATEWVSVMGIPSALDLLLQAFAVPDAEKNPTAP